MTSSMPTGSSAAASYTLARTLGQARAPQGDSHPGARIDLLLKLSHGLWGACIHHALEQHGLTHSDYVTLLVMHTRPDWVPNPSLLAAAIAETPTNTTRICDRLTRRGLIRRVGSTSDRRRVDLTLTDAGEALAAAVAPLMDHLLDEAISILTSEEQASLERMLERLSRGLMEKGAGKALRGRDLPE
jgi:DNA-binding MarR family transcriptional regulator